MVCSSGGLSNIVVWYSAHLGAPGRFEISARAARASEKRHSASQYFRQCEQGVQTGVRSTLTEIRTRSFNHQTATGAQLGNRIGDAVIRRGTRFEMSWRHHNQVDIQDFAASDDFFSGTTAALLQPDVPYTSRFSLNLRFL
jgi:hypothetical protein